MADDSDFFNFRLITPDGVLFDDRVVFAKVPGVVGECGILANHSPSVFSLQVGELCIQKDTDTQWYFLPGGMVEVQSGSGDVTVLTDYAEKTTDIDQDRVKSALGRAKKRLINPNKNIEVNRAKAAFVRAESRLSILEKAAG